MSASNTTSTFDINRLSVSIYWADETPEPGDLGRGNQYLTLGVAPPAPQFDASLIGILFWKLTFKVKVVT